MFATVQQVLHLRTALSGEFLSLSDVVSCMIKLAHFLLIKINGINGIRSYFLPFCFIKEMR